MDLGLDAAPIVAARKPVPLGEVIATEKRRTSRRRWVGGLVVVALGLVALALYVALRPKAPSLTSLYRSEVVTEGDVVREVRATGRLGAVETVDVGAEISGRIVAVEVDYNDHVTAGQVLARLDRSALLAQATQVRATLAASLAVVEQAKTERDRSARELSRSQFLFASGALPAVEHDGARSTAQLMEQRLTAADAQVLAGRASLQLATTNLDHTTIRSPIDGVVITRNVDPGQTVAATFQTPVLFSVAADLRKMRVIATVDEADIGEVATAQHAVFTVNAYPGRTFSGAVTQVRSSPQIVQDVVTYGTEVEVDNADLALKPGMTASVRIRTAEATHVQRVSMLALRFTPPGELPSPSPTLWQLADGALHRVEVLPGVSDGELVEIAGGALQTGSTVLVELTPEGRKAHALAP